MNITFKEINGKFINYSEVFADNGYCFYNKNDTEEERTYLTHITSPLKTIEEFNNEYVVIQGNADELNKIKEEQVNGRDR